MNLIINNRIINAPIAEILSEAVIELRDGRLSYFKQKHDNVVCTCPFHKGGMERRPSMNIYCGDSPDILYGTAHCFTCDYKAALPKFIGDLFEDSVDFGKDWLLEHFAGDFVEEAINLPPIEDEKPAEKKILDPNILDQYMVKHPYMYMRGLTDDIIERFKIGYDKEADAIVFPVWDEYDNLVALTRRSVSTKQFYIPDDIEKPVYLLNVAKRYNTVAVCESQLNTLNCWRFGIPAVGLFGTGSKKQLETLKKSGIRHFILLFDGDEAGRKGATKFKNAMPDDKLITDVHMYWGKDVSDLTQDMFDKLMKDNGIELIGRV